MFFRAKKDKELCLTVHVSLVCTKWAHVGVVIVAFGVFFSYRNRLCSLMRLHLDT